MTRLNFLHDSCRIAENGLPLITLNSTKKNSPVCGDQAGALRGRNPFELNLSMQNIIVSNIVACSNLDNTKLILSSPQNHDSAHLAVWFVSPALCSSFRDYRIALPCLHAVPSMPHIYKTVLC